MSCATYPHVHEEFAVLQVNLTLVLQVKEAVDEALEWLDDNGEAEEDEFKEKLKEVEDKCNPIVSKAYQAAGGPGGDDDEDLGSHDEL